MCFEKQDLFREAVSQMLALEKTEELHLWTSGDQAGT